ncbi:dual specificity protein phosphatase family protein [Thermogemmatispora sp.]|uniref:protein-tyrosine phosphatase family protein n=1 Tax=Thermogemmatispora sp. TaxID=1968838 RepID=UPI0035E3FACB
MAVVKGLYTVDLLKDQRLSIMGHPAGGALLEQAIKMLRQAGVDVLVSLLTGEEIEEIGLQHEAQTCQEQGVRYFHFPIADLQGPPLDGAIQDLLSELYGLLEAGLHIAIHCRLGIGRSAMIAAALLVRAGYSAPLAVGLLSSARGCFVPQTPAQLEWIEALERYYRRQGQPFLDDDG